MEYLIAFQLLCGAFGAYLARRKNRSVVLWFGIAAVVPVAGVVLALVVGKAGRTEAKKAKRKKGEHGGKNRPRRPRRCNGSYISDCRGCPYFYRPLFDTTYDENHKGRCRFYDRELYEEKVEKVKK